ncbi:unnamed protein product [Durusdinium trenchii]|uniref:Calpain catalytic domain-containing protein n=1 Tax=Durusdinium trenchii TaxID=1381693 RepID=A0ABP0K8S0_9DINO
MRVHVLLTLALAEAAQWPAQVIQSCGFSSPNAVVSDVEGSLTLSVPKLCGAVNYPCRHALFAAVNAMRDDAFKDIYKCALPWDRQEKLVMASFVVQGLKPQQYGQWGTWLGNAFAHCPDLSGFEPKASTSYPDAGGIRFLVSGTGTAHDNAKIEQCLGSNMQASSGLSWSRITVSNFGISKVESEPLFQIGMKNFMILLRFGAVILVALGLYGIVAVCAYYSGVKWLQPILLCWPEVCDGRGCFVYRVLCCPFVLIWHAFYIYCFHCCHSYISFLCMPACFKGMCWDDFQDPEFPPNDNSLGKLKGDTAGGLIHQGGGTDWVRAAEIAEKDGWKRTVKTIEGHNFLMVASKHLICCRIAALATRRHRRGVKGQLGTEWKTIVIDEKIPCYAGTTKPRFAQANSREIWVLLMEKAFAKMYGGYDKLEGGVMSWALSAITGNPAVNFLRMSGVWNAFKPAGGGQLTQEGEFSDDEFFKFLHRIRRNGAFICCSTIVPPDRKGLINGHAYSVLDLQTVAPDVTSGEYFRMVQIRNPHGQGEWQGAWSDKSPLWEKHPRVKRKILGGEEPKDDGSFWMQWEDFVVFWKDVQVVDCDTNIHTVAMPDYDEETWCGPIISSLQGCFEYWCCCVGCKRLYLGRAGGKNLEEMKKDMNNQCGYDQRGFYCHLFERRAVADDAYLSSDEESGMLRR